MECSFYIMKECICCTPNVDLLVLLILLTTQKTKWSPVVMTTTKFMEAAPMRSMKNQIHCGMNKFMFYVYNPFLNSRLLCKTANKPRTVIRL